MDGVRILIIDSTTEQEQKVFQEDIDCERCKFTFRTNAYLKDHIESMHSKGPTCHASDHNDKPRLCREYPWECNLLDHKAYEEYKRAQQVNKSRNSFTASQKTNNKGKQV